MIRFIKMRTKRKIKLTLVLLSFSYSILIGQIAKIVKYPKPDTLYVYDTIVKRDTIWLRKNKPKALVLVLEALPRVQLTQIRSITPKKDKNLHFSTFKTATFSPNRIIQSDNLITLKQSDKMKKRALAFSILLFTFQELIGQNHISITSGTGLYYNKSTPDTNFTTQPKSYFKVGITAFRYFDHKRFSYGASLNYVYMLRSDFKPIPSRITIINPSVPYEDYSRNYHLLAMPLYIEWHEKAIKPILGAEVHCKLSPKKSYLRTNTLELKPYSVPVWGLSLMAGLEIEILPRISARFNYLHEITKQERLEQATWGTNTILGSRLQLNGNQYITQMRRFELTCSFLMARRKIKVLEDSQQ
jgi:hypothetical protein